MTLVGGMNGSNGHGSGQSLETRLPLALASFMVRCSRRLYRSGILELTGVSHARRWSDAIWNFGLAMMKRKGRS